MWASNRYTLAPLPLKVVTPLNFRLPYLEQHVPLPIVDCTLPCTCRILLWKAYALAHPLPPAVRLTGTLSGHPPALILWPPAPSQSQGPGTPTSSGGSADMTLLSPAIGASNTTGPDQATTSKTDTSPLLVPNTGLLGIPAGLVKKIREGSYVDLGDLLPEALEWAFERAADDKSTDKEKQKKFQVVSITDWILAFSIFAAITVQLKPERAVTLVTYTTIIARLAREVPGWVWFRYDRLFRQAAAVNPSLAWDRKEPDIWLAAMVNTHSQQGQLKSPLHIEQVPRGKKRSCAVALIGASVFFQQCKYRHAYGICRSCSHPARDCHLLHTPAKRPPPGERRQGPAPL